MITSFKDTTNTLFLLCDCKNEILHIEYDAEIGLADVAIYEHYMSSSNKMSFWQKLRYIWRVLATNKPYGDQLLLDKKQLKELMNFLNSIL